MRTLRNVFMAFVMAFGLLMAAPVPAAEVNPVPSSAVKELQSPAQPRHRVLDSEAAKNPQLLADPNCPIEPRVPWVMGTW